MLGSLLLAGDPNDDDDDDDTAFRDCYKSYLQKVTYSNYNMFMSL